MIEEALVQETPSRIVLLVIDGLGGLPHPTTGKTELESAHTPHLDALAQKSSLGLTEPVGPGITPGSGAGHLALFGYDPVRYDVGRGVLEALGIDFELQPGDVAVRGNFCRVDPAGVIQDRRAGRLADEAAAQLCQKLSQITPDGVQLFVRPVKEHRFVLVLRGEGVGAGVTDSDPQKEGLRPLEVRAKDPQGEKTAALANRFVRQALARLQGEEANMVLLRGFSQTPHWPSLRERFRLRPAAIAAYPMYRGLARLVGMEVLPPPSGIAGTFRALETSFREYNYFFVHIKDADVAGEDGDFECKVQAIEEVDREIPRLLALKPEVLIVTGDHSTPAVLKGHSWHPVPFLLFSPTCRPDGIKEFGERACARGSLGRFPALDVLPLALAHARKLNKYGA